MLSLRTVSVTVVILTSFLHAQGADKYTDENRPYEFGFTIDGEQHRHEKKDDNGLIMGEFGFITADGVYHVTVYATDEHGNFKIVSMKNIRIKPYPTAPERKGNSLPFPPSQNAPTPQKPVSIEPPARSCSHCSIPTTTRAPDLTDYAVVSRDENPQYPYTNQNYPEENYPQNPEQNLQPGDRNPKQYDNVPPQYPQDSDVPNKPTLISAQMQIVDRNTDTHHLGPGEMEGLPNGLTKKDMHLLLYTFNYTVGFHGHHEEGYTDGTKTGYYYVTGRNGVRTRVDYVADENGFRPKISQEILDIISEDVPKPETEKDAKYGLKGYEFKWIYYPVDSKR